jgi:hypothetical protein
VRPSLTAWRQRWCVESWGIARVYPTAGAGTMRPYASPPAREWRRAHWSARILAGPVDITAKTWQCIVGRQEVSVPVYPEGTHFQYKCMSGICSAVLGHRVWCTVLNSPIRSSTWLVAPCHHFLSLNHNLPTHPRPHTLQLPPTRKTLDHIRCGAVPNQADFHVAGMQETVPVRLSGGQNPWEGRVEVLINDTWWVVGEDMHKAVRSLHNMVPEPPSRVSFPKRVQRVIHVPCMSCQHQISVQPCSRVPMQGSPLCCHVRLSRSVGMQTVGFPRGSGSCRGHVSGSSWPFAVCGMAGLHKRASRHQAMHQ